MPCCLDKMLNQGLICGCNENGNNDDDDNSDNVNSDNIIDTGLPGKWTPGSGDRSLILSRATITAPATDPRIHPGLLGPATGIAQHSQVRREGLPERIFLSFFILRVPRRIIRM